jgi:uncharacterized membrane protein
MLDPIDNPLNYKFGIIYYNPNDGRLIVPKRERALGWTFNFAHKISLVVLLLLFIIIGYTIVQ